MAACGAGNLQSYSLENTNERTARIRSIDKMFQIGVGPDLFAQLAVIHAGADLLCGGADVETLDVAFEFGPELDVQGRLSLSQGMFLAAADAGIKVGKCHSTFGPVTAVTLAMSGRTTIEYGPNCDEGALLLTRKLGAMRNLYLATLHEDSPGCSAAVDVMLQGHHELLRQLGSHVSAVVDVSGFGLAGALHEMALGLNAELYVPLQALGTRWLQGDVDPECLASELGTLLDEFEIDPSQRVRLSTREFCGPMVLAVDHGKVEEVLRVAERCGFADIGVIGTYSVSSAKLHLV